MTLEDKQLASTQERNAAQSQPLPKLRGHLPALDGIRGIAILAVLLHHFCKADVDASGGDHVWWLRASEMGRIGVDLFFVLSGFLITGIVLDNKPEQGSSKAFLRSFYVRRSLRIFPLYYLALTIAFLVFPILGISSPYSTASKLWLALYGTNVAITFYDWTFPFLVHFWSLAVEEHFYIVWPAVVLFCSYRRTVICCLTLIVIAPVVRIALAKAGYPSYFFTLSRVDGLAWGALLATLLRNRTGAALVRSVARPICAALIILVIAGAYIGAKVARMPLTADSTRYSGVVIVFSLFVTWAVLGSRQMPVARILSWAPLRFFGLYSYGLYVYHGLFGGYFDRWFASDRFLPMTGQLFAAVVIKVLCCGVVSLLIAVLSFHVIERPLLSLKRFFEYRPKPAMNEAKSFDSANNVS